MITEKFLDAGQGVLIKANRITGKGFRLVHNDKEVVATIEGTEKTETLTILKVEEFETAKEIESRINNLKLTAKGGGKYENKKV